MQWRQIGPFRGGRALTIEGVPGEPDTYYFGAVAGGVWKTIDGGVNWTPDGTRLLFTAGAQTIRHEQTPDYSGVKIIYTISERRQGESITEAERWLRGQEWEVALVDRFLVDPEE